MASHDAIGESEQTPSLHAQSSEPSLMHHDVIGAQNRSPSRKRPRLDSGSETTQSVSADLVLASPHKSVEAETDNTMEIDCRPVTPESRQTIAKKPTGTPSKVTINVRTPAKRSASPITNGHHKVNGDKALAKGANGINGHAKTCGVDASGRTSPQSASSPDVEVAEAEYDGDEEEVSPVRMLDGRTFEERIATIYHEFPYVTDGGHVQGAELIAEAQIKSEQRPIFAGCHI